MSSTNSRVIRPAAEKLKIIEETRAEGAVKARICERYNVAPGLVYTWQQQEKELRKAAEREAKAAAKESAKAHTNGHTNGHATMATLAAQAEPKPKLFITGLPALIKELVEVEVAKQLRPIVERKINELVSSGLGIAQENKTN